jgi:tetrahydromethanopterin S-methyltransferase subunit A
MTANLGIEEIVWAVLDRPWLRFLLVCGRDSPLFAPGQSLISLAHHGVNAADGRIIGAEGHLPFLSSVTMDEVVAFRRQLRMIDRRGVSEPGPLRELARVLARQACCDQLPPAPARNRQRREFTVLRPVGRRHPIARAGEGFFVISLHRGRRLIVVEHYLPDLSPGHRMCGVRAESILLGLLAGGVVRENSHVGYLGIELGKAESALRLGYDYRQDMPPRRRGCADRASGVGTEGT